MSLVAKVFIVINQILSLALVSLMAILLVHQSDYKVRMINAQRELAAVLATHERAKADYDLQVENLRASVRDLDDQANRALTRIVELETLHKSNAQELNKLLLEIDTLDNQDKLLARTNLDKSQRKNDLEAKKAEVEGRLTEAKQHRDEWLGKLQAEEEKVRRFRSELESK